VRGVYGPRRLHAGSVFLCFMTQVEKRWPESSYFLLSREEQQRAACRSEAVRLAMGEIPKHLTADTVSCKQLPVSRLVPHVCCLAGRTTTARARLAPQATSDYDELMEGFREVRQYVDSTLQRAR